MSYVDLRMERALTRDTAQINCQKTKHLQSTLRPLLVPSQVHWWLQCWGNAQEPSAGGLTWRLLSCKLKRKRKTQINGVYIQSAYITNIYLQQYPLQPSPEIRRGSTTSHFSFSEMVLECHLLLKQFRERIKQPDHWKLLFNGDQLLIWH